MKYARCCAALLASVAARSARPSDSPACRDNGERGEECKKPRDRVDSAGFLRTTFRYPARRGVVPLIPGTVWCPGMMVALAQRITRLAESGLVIGLCARCVFHSSHLPSLCVCCQHITEQIPPLACLLILFAFQESLATQIVHTITVEPLCLRPELSS